MIARYHVIILRDLDPQNRKKSIYRGLARSAANWQRMKVFAKKEQLDIDFLRPATAKALVDFLKEEVCYVNRGGEGCCPDCNQQTLEDFAQELGLSVNDLPCSWHDLCCLD